MFVTGHTGFKGAWLSAWLIHMGADVCGYSDAIPTEPALFERLELSKHMQTTFADIRDFASIRKAIAQSRPQIIFHLAAQSLVRPSYDRPLDTFSTNIMGTANLLEAARTAMGLQAVVIATSDKCYLNRESGVPFVENDPMGGDDPYSASKGAAELVFTSYFKSFFSRSHRPGVVSVRAGNVIGGGDWAKDRVVPDCIRAWSSGEKVLLRSPESVRPWQHVLDPLAGYLQAAKAAATQSEINGESYNFGPGENAERTVLEVVKSLAEECQFSKNWQIDANAAKGKKESIFLKLNPEKAKRSLGWHARLNFEAAVTWTGNWYNVAHGSPGQMFDFTLSQIKAFESLE